jgi:hypothetical protein
MRLARSAQSRRGGLGRPCLALACLISALALPASALADAPAQDQYVVPKITATGGGGASPHEESSSQTALAPSAAERPAESGSRALGILALGLGAILTAAGLLAYARRNALRA